MTKSSIKYYLITVLTLVGAKLAFTQPLDVSISGVIPASCNSVCDGEVLSLTTGGSAPYSFQWIDLSIPAPISGETDTSITGLCAGNYAIVVVDNIGAIDSAFVTITEPLVLTTLIAGQGDATCTGVCDGTATVTPFGGTPPYSYLWLDSSLVPLVPGQTDSVATSLCALMYVIRVEDFNGCSSLLTVTITEPSALTLNVDSVTTAQCTVCDGAATVSATGGVSPYSYAWNDNFSQTGPVADSLCASIYEVTVSDSNNCITIADVMVTGPNGLIATVDTTTDITCDGLCDGQATVVGAGGNPPYTYLWIDLSIPDTINGATDSTLTNICAGNYYVFIRDNSSCFTFGPVLTFTDPPPFTANMLDSNGVNCFGDSNGTATVAISNGVPPFGYVWSNGDSSIGLVDITDTVIDLVSGNYSVTVTDFNGCIAIDSVFISAPSFLNATISGSINVSCAGICDGSAFMIPTGGTPPYTYLWDAGGTPNDSVATGLCSGTHTLTLTDVNLCDTVTTVIITEPAVLQVAVSGSNSVSCNGICNGDATVTATGGVTPYTILWSNNDSSSVADSLCPGLYTVTVLDSNNCIDEDSVLISEPSILVANIIDSSATCEPLCNGSAEASPIGGTNPYSYLWLNGDTVPIADSLCSGMQVLVLTDAKGCIAMDSAVVVGDTSPPTLDAGLDEEICIGETAFLSASGGGNYSWSPSVGLSCTNCPSPQASPSVTTTYTVTATNIVCTDNDQVAVTVVQCLLGAIPEVITPNGDGTNDVFEISNIEKFPENHVDIYSQWGVIVFSTDGYHNISNNWDGTHNSGTNLPDATYFYNINLGDGSETLSGFVMIYR